MAVAIVPGLLAVVLGIAAGWGIRLLLGRLRRGAVLRPGAAELAAGAITGVGVAVSWPGPLTILVVWTGLLGVALGAVDLLHHRLPDALTLPAVPVSGVLVVVTAVVFPGSGSLVRALIVAVAGTGLLALIAAVAPRAMGRGDVKLIGSLAAMTGYVSAPSFVLALLIAVTLGALMSLLGLALRRLSLSSAIPFGPFLLLGAWSVLSFPELVFVIVG
jgi:leader peptidase (prepilin peptidase)/N-methyltransferase